MNNHHPSEEVPEPFPGFVSPWSPFVDAVMSFAEEAKALDARAPDGDFGRGLHDFVDGQRLEMADIVAKLVFDKDPEAWATLIRSSLIMVQGSESDQQLIDRLKHLGGLTTQWIADVQRRSVIGVQL